MKTLLSVVVSAWILSAMAGAQTGPPAQKILTNQDIVMLAKAGFTEEFIIGAIQSGRSHFDTSAAGLADMAKEGLNEHVVRAMAGAASEPGACAPSQPTAQPSPLLVAQPVSQHAGQPAATEPYPEEMVLPGPEMKTRVQVVKPTRAGLAIAAQTPYYESTSVLFGLYHKKVAVGAIPRRDQIISPQLGPGSSSSRMMANFPTLVAPAGSANRYVVIP